MAATETSARANAVLDELYREHVGDVYRYTFAVLGNHADAEDVTQTTFVNALRALERGEVPEDPSRWLTVIAHNLVRQRWRQAAARPTLVELETDVADAEEDDDGFELEELVRALQRIPETQREAIVMRELEGRSYREIATVMGLSTSALETLLFRARRSLADELENVVTCQNAELALSKSIDGRLSRKERRRLDEHLADCPDCTRLAATQQRRRRAFKGLALLPLPIGLALFKGAPSAAAATSLPTIGLGTAGAGSSGTSAAGAGATAATTSGGAAVGGSLAGGLVVKIAAIVVTATIATGVGYKGVESVRHTPAKTPPADVRKTTGKTGAPTAAVAPRATHAAPVKKAPVQAKRHAKPASSPGRAKHGASPQPGLATSQSAKAPGNNSAVAAASGSAPSAGPKPHHPTGGAAPKHVDPPTKPKAPAAGGKAPAAPKAGNGSPSTPSAGNPAPPKTPSSGGSSGASSGGVAVSPTGGASTVPEQDVTPTQTQQPSTSSPSTPPASAVPTTTPPSTAPPETTPPAEQTPPGGTTETPPGSTDWHPNNGWDNGKKLGFYNENQDGKHLVTP